MVSALQGEQQATEVLGSRGRKARRATHKPNR